MFVHVTHQLTWAFYEILLSVQTFFLSWKTYSNFSSKLSETFAPQLPNVMFMLMRDRPEEMGYFITTSSDTFAV